jgi:membrane-associated phospholipid phosphatase
MAKPKPPILWKRGALWLAFLGPFFFISYGWVNHITSQRSDIGVIVYAWEQYIPFVPSLMLPYMSIDAFYAASLFLHRKRNLLDRHALRLLMATVISCIGFLLAPLRFSFEVPHTDGFNGQLQNLLLGFDKPYNQAPSLHISLLIILWVVYAKRLHGFARLALHLWFFAIGASVLLVYQHHFVDVWTGAMVGVICLYLIPDPPFFWHLRKPSGIMKRLGLRYGIASMILFMATAVLMEIANTWFALLLWPTFALGMVAMAYFGLERQIFQRHSGTMRWPARLILAPYLFGAWLSYRYYSNGRSIPVQVAERVWLGAFPRWQTRQTEKKWHAIIDMTNEFATASNSANRKKYIPVMDLTPPCPRHLVRAVRWLENTQQEGQVLVHCALGLSRSASVIVCWLTWKGHEMSVEAASLALSRLRPGILLTEEHKANIIEALNYLQAS